MFCAILAEQMFGWSGCLKRLATASGQPFLKNFQETFCWIGNKVYLCAPLKAAERRWVRSERKKFEKKFGRMEITLTFALRYKKG
jgi:hypothetical protein